MPSRIGVPKKKILPSKKKRKKKARKKDANPKSGLLRRAASLMHARRKPEVAQSDGEPPFVPMLFFSDVDAAVHFFTVKLGFDLVYQRHTLHGHTGLCAVKYPGVYLLLGHAEGLDAASLEAFRANPRGIGVRFVITVHDLDVFYRELVARHVAVDGPPQPRLWGRKEFSLAEPLEGYRFTFSQPEPIKA